MRIVLGIIDAECPSDRVAEQIGLALQRAKELFPSLKYWGKYRDKKKDLDTLADLSTLLKKLKPGDYAVSDVEEGDGATEFRVSAREEVVSFRLYRDVDPQELRKECAILTEYFKGLYAQLRGTIAFPLVSSITLLDVEYPQPRPPKVWGAFDPWGMVDFVKTSGECLPEEGKTIESLAGAPLPPRAERTALEDLVLVDWLPLREETLKEKLSRRCLWYYENGGLLQDPSYNDAGDRKVDIVANQKTEELTFYDAVTQTGYKAIGVDPHDHSYETDKVAQLEKFLKKGSVSKGLPLAKAYLVVSKREFAVLLQPVAREHHLEGVLYADDAAQLWDPFPEERT